MVRLFVALKIPESILNRVLNYCYKAVEEPSKFNWETTEKIHLTLKFIGEVDESLVGTIAKELEFVKNYSSFSCSISKFGFFFRKGVPRILWSNLKTDGPLIPLVAEINDRLESFGIESEKRKFNAHLTLLRIKHHVSQKLVNNLDGFKFKEINFNADKISLVKSELSPHGATYKDLIIYELK